MKGTSASRLLRRLLAVLALAVMFQLAAVPGQAFAWFEDGYTEEYTDGYEGDGADGPGTRFRKCRAEAFADFNECLMENPGDTSHEVACFFAWDVDNIGCDTQFILDLAGVFGLFKGDAK